MVPPVRTQWTTQHTTNQPLLREPTTHSVHSASHFLRMSYSERSPSDEKLRTNAAEKGVMQTLFTNNTVDPADCVALSHFAEYFVLEKALKVRTLTTLRVNVASPTLASIIGAEIGVFLWRFFSEHNDQVKCVLSH